MNYIFGKKLKQPDFQVEDRVEFYDDGNRQIGLVRWIKLIPEIDSDDYTVGVQLVCSEQGNSEQSSKAGSIICVAASKVKRTKNIGGGNNTEACRIYSSDTKESSLQLDDRIVYFNHGSGEPHRGVVKWKGVLKEMNGELTIGVEFDDPVGNMDGGWSKKKLFVAKPKHGLLVPVQSLIKEKDYFAVDGDKNDNLKYEEKIPQTAIKTVKVNVTLINDRNQSETVCVNADPTLPMKQLQKLCSGINDDFEHQTWLLGSLVLDLNENKPLKDYGITTDEISVVCFVRSQFPKQVGKDKYPNVSTQAVNTGAIPKPNCKNSNAINQGFNMGPKSGFSKKLESYQNSGAAKNRQANFNEGYPNISNSNFGRNIGSYSDPKQNSNRINQSYQPYSATPKQNNISQSSNAQYLNKTKDDNYSKRIRLQLIISTGEESTGPINFVVFNFYTLKDIQELAFQKFHIPREQQRWFVECSSRWITNHDTVADMGITENDSLVYLYVKQVPHDIKKEMPDARRNSANVATSSVGSLKIQAKLIISETNSKDVTKIVKLDPHTTGAEFKVEIYKALKVPVELQVLYLNKMNVEDDKALFEYNFTEGSSIFLFIKSSPVAAQVPTRPVQQQNKVKNYEKLSIIVNLEGESISTFKMDVKPNTTISDLKAKILHDYDIPPDFQRWIINRKLCLNDGDTMALLDVIDGSEVYVHVHKSGWSCPQCTYINPPTRPGCRMCSCERPEDYVLPAKLELDAEEEMRLKKEEETDERGKKAVAEEKQAALHHYQELVEIDDVPVVLNTKSFDCCICYTGVEPGEGIVIRECLHEFCKDCLEKHVLYCEDTFVRCPYIEKDQNCESVLQHREIQSIVDDETFEKFLKKSLTVAEGAAASSFHCRTPNCAGWCEYEDHVNVFDCPVCMKPNCITCRAIHENKNCKEYQSWAEMNITSEDSKEARQSKEFLNNLLKLGKGMRCPGCKLIIAEKVGCDWVQCSVCRMEICWATKGPRWGPNGKGDVSGGCRCRVNNAPCAPNCMNCH